MIQEKPFRLMMDKPLPALLTINETAMVLRGEDPRRPGKPTRAAVDFVRGMVAEGKLKAVRRRSAGTVIFIKAVSLRDCVS